VYNLHCNVSAFYDVKRVVCVSDFFWIGSPCDCVCVMISVARLPHCLNCLNYVQKMHSVLCLVVLWFVVCHCLKKYFSVASWVVSNKFCTRLLGKVPFVCMLVIMVLCLAISFCKSVFTYAGAQIPGTRLPGICAVACIVCGSSVWSLLFGTLLMPGIYIYYFIYFNLFFHHRCVTFDSDLLLFCCLVYTYIYSYMWEVFKSVEVKRGMRSLS
jgi:hypothetical protein